MFSLQVSFLDDRYTQTQVMNPGILRIGRSIAPQYYEWGAQIDSATPKGLQFGGAFYDPSSRTQPTTCLFLRSKNDDLYSHTLTLSRKPHNKLYVVYQQWNEQAHVQMNHQTWTGDEFLFYWDGVTIQLV